MGLELIKMRRPEPAVRLEPDVQRFQRLGAYPVETSLGVTARLDEPRVLQHPEVL